MPPVRTLFVDDEPSLRETLPQILAMHGFEVTTAATVFEALQEITQHSFDVLISDLNIGHPGDGFMVVHAMRQGQPQCVNFILTGYPAFESALQAIRSQVDDYIIKPADPLLLVENIRSKLQTRQPRCSVPSQRLAAIIRDHIDDIAEALLSKMKAHPELAALPLDDHAHIYPLLPLLGELADILDSPEPDTTPTGTLRTAALRGELRFAQGYSIPLLVDNVRLLENAIYEVIHENMLSLDLSFLMIDLRRLNDSLAIQLKESLAAYLEAQEKAA